MLGVKSLLNPKKIFSHAPGMRVIKTAIAACIILTLRLALDISLEYALTAAVLALQQTPDQTLAAGLNRLLGTLLGAIGGFLVLTLADYIPGYQGVPHLFIIPLGLVLVCWICLLLNRPTGIALSCVIYLGIVSNFGRDIADTGLYVLVRMFDTSLGVVVAVAVDYFVLPQRPGSPRPPDQATPEAPPPEEAKAPEQPESSGEGG